MYLYSNRKEYVSLLNSYEVAFNKVKILLLENNTLQAKVNESLKTQKAEEERRQAHQPPPNIPPTGQSKYPSKHPSEVPIYCSSNMNYSRHHPA